MIFGLECTHGDSVMEHSTFFVPKGFVTVAVTSFIPFLGVAFCSVLLFGLVFMWFPLWVTVDEVLMAIPKGAYVAYTATFSILTPCNSCRNLSLTCTTSTHSNVTRFRRRATAAVEGGRCIWVQSRPPQP